MNNYIEIKSRLLETLKELERELHYSGTKEYVESLRQKEYLNGKEKFYLRLAEANLRRIKAYRRSKSLGLIPFIPYDERQDKSEEIQGNYLSWDRSVCLFVNK
jgi:hypothetical protein